MRKKTVVERGGRYYLVSTVVDTMMGLCETLVFPCDHDGEVLDWEEVAGVRCSSAEEALETHQDFLSGDLKILDIPW